MAVAASKSTVKVTPAQLARGIALQSGRRQVIVVTAPQNYRGRLVGALFETNKTFLLPSAIPGVIGLVQYFDEHPGAEVLVVGHTDTTGANGYNLQLSVERAETMAAFLLEDASAWMAWFDEDEEQKRWGRREVQHMLTALPDKTAPLLLPSEVGAASDARHQAAVRAFQTFSNDTRGTNLAVDGIDGPKTREALVEAYMAIDGTSLPPGTTLSTHGCGPFHPQVPTGPNTDEPKNRRVEIFLFGDGVSPPAVPCTAPGCVEYPQWVAALVETIDLDVAELASQLPLEIAVLKSAAGPIQLVVQDAGGADAAVLPESSAVDQQGGFAVFSLAPATLPNPAVFVRRDAVGDELLGGPVDLFALRAALRDGDLDKADALLGILPDEGPNGGAGVAADFDDSHL